MKELKKITVLWILLTLQLVMTALQASCQGNLIESKKDSTQLEVLRQISDPKVKRTVLRVLDDYPSVKAERDSCERLNLKLKLAGSLMTQQIVQLEARQEKTRQELGKIEAHSNKLLRRLRWWRGTTTGVVITLATILLITK